jgi:Tfp pilus assembly protein PilN
MIRVNLLPPQQRLPLRSWSSIVKYCGLITVLLLLAIYLYNIHVLSQLQEQTANMRNSYALLLPAEEKMLAVQEQQQTLKVKREILIRLTNERISWYAIVAQFGRITPSQVRLTDISSNRQNLIQVKGVAQSYPDLALFLSRLEQDNLFTSPILIKAEQVNNSAATGFEIVVKIKGI